MMHEFCTHTHTAYFVNCIVCNVEWIDIFCRQRGLFKYLPHYICKCCRSIIFQLFLSFYLSGSRFPKAATFTFIGISCMCVHAQCWLTGWGDVARTYIPLQYRSTVCSQAITMFASEIIFPYFNHRTLLANQFRYPSSFTHSLHVSVFIICYGFQLLLFQNVLSSN